MKATTTTLTRQDALIESNVQWLRQALRLLERMDDATYRDSPPGLAPHRVGGHLRHIIEFYQCFLNGLEFSYVDYDCRARDKTIESNCGAAMLAVQSIIRALESTALLREEHNLWVRIEDAEGLGVEDSFADSSISRELQMLSSHTIHHFALIAVTLRLHGIDVDPEFGMAPSTLRYMAARMGEAA
jgi:hypothetical protein